MKGHKSAYVEIERQSEQNIDMALQLKNEFIALGISF